VVSLGERLFAAIYDPLQSGAEHGWMGRRRAALLAGVEGDVCEIGAGTGANLAHYGQGAHVTACEPSAPMRAHLAAKLDSARVPVTVLPAPAEAIPVGDASFDVVVATLVLCTVRDVDASLAEVRRVLRPGGRLLFIEHGGDHPGRRGAWQRRVEPVWTRLACGCHLTRDARANIERAGLTITECEEFDPPRLPALLRPFVQGVAVS
jgi:ubiquinone/menaquinone biosynthesis C-methylase UbiE